MRFLVECVVIYVVVVAILYLVQRSMIYFPDTMRPDPIEGVETVGVETVDGLRLQSWYIAPSREGRPVIVYFHGNAGHYGHRLHKASYYLKEGYGVLLAGYRGYGGNEGRPSEDGFYRDGRANIEWLKSEQGFESDDIVLYGESIGSGTAVQMAYEYDVSALVLETPFSSLADVAQRQYPIVPVRYLLRDQFANDSKIGEVNCPVLILHGTSDSTISYMFAEKLYEAAVKPKKFVTVPNGGHNDLYNHGIYNDILTFLSGL